MKVGKAIVLVLVVISLVMLTSIEICLAWPWQKKAEVTTKKPVKPAPGVQGLLTNRGGDKCGKQY